MGRRQCSEGCRGPGGGLLGVDVVCNRGNNRTKRFHRVKQSGSSERA